jgi:hypothetical protein
MTQTAEQEIAQLRKQLTAARHLINEVKDYLENGGYLGQDTGLIYQCEEILEGRIPQ